jgi:hypothetical protein
MEKYQEGVLSVCIPAFSVLHQRSTLHTPFFLDTNAILLLNYFVAGPVKSKNITQRFQVAQQKGVENFTQDSSKRVLLRGPRE